MKIEKIRRKRGKKKEREWEKNKKKERKEHGVEGCKPVRLGSIEQSRRGMKSGARKKRKTGVSTESAITLMGTAIITFCS